MEREAELDDMRWWPQVREKAEVDMLSLPCRVGGW